MLGLVLGVFIITSDIFLPFLMLHAQIRTNKLGLSFRFLRARKFDIVAAKTMLLNAEKWRKEFGVDELTKCVSTWLLLLGSDASARVQEL